MIFVQAPPGQQINVTLMDYTPAVKSPAVTSPAVKSPVTSTAGRRLGSDTAAWCPVIVQLREVSDDVDSTPRETVVRACDSRVRKRLIYTSRGSKVRVTMPTTAAAARPTRPVVGYYLLYFEGN